VNTLATVDPNQHDQFILRQRTKLVVNQYEFSLPAEDGFTPGTPFCFVQQARFKFKEDIRFYTDDSRSVELLRIKARQRFDPRARYDVTMPDGQKVGEIQKAFGKSLLRSTYTIFDAQGNEVASAHERSRFVALFRRLTGFIPYVGDFSDWLPIAYHFDFMRGDQKIGSHDRKLFSFRDVYRIDMSADPQRTVDRRLVLALAVGMDALQAR
jgi:uncharacterized protein YxjI